MKNIIFLGLILVLTTALFTEDLTKKYSIEVLK